VPGSELDFPPLNEDRTSIDTHFSVAGAHTRAGLRQAAAASPREGSPAQPLRLRYGGKPRVGAERIVLD
jgi:hypothetical protein